MWLVSEHMRERRTTADLLRVGAVDNDDNSDNSNEKDDDERCDDNLHTRSDDIFFDCNESHFQHALAGTPVDDRHRSESRNDQRGRDGRR
jgi:hypothetical protein